MNKFFIIILVTIFTHSLSAQNKLNAENISYGKNYQGFPGTLKKYFTVDSVLLSICFYRKTIVLQTFDRNTLKVIRSKDYNGFPKKVLVEDVLEFNNNVYLFYSTLVHNDTVFKEKLYMRKINVDSCAFEKTKLLMSVDGDVIGGISGRENADNFSFSNSLDKKQLLIQYQRKGKKKDVAEIGYKVFDKDFKLVWEKEAKMPYENWRMENIDFTLDNQNNIYLASYIYRQKPGFDVFAPYKAEMSDRVTSSGLINCDLEIFKFGASSGVFTKSKIKLDSGYHINSFKFFQIGNNQLIGAGYSSTVGRNNKFNETSGAFKFDLLDKDRRVDTCSFSEKIVNQNLKKSEISLNTSMKRRYRKEWKWPVKNLVPKELILERDGGYILVGEQQKRRISHTVVPTPVVVVHTTTEHMHYDHVLISKFNKEGSLTWMKKLAKRQESTYGVDFFGLDKKGLSYKLIEGEEDLYILYMDQLKNLKLLTSTKRPAKFISDDYGVLTAYKIDRSSGEGSKALILDVNRINGLSTGDFNIEGISSFGRDEFIFEGYYENKDMSEAHLRLTNVLGFLTLVNLK